MHIRLLSRLVQMHSPRSRSPLALIVPKSSAGQLLYYPSISMQSRTLIAQASQLALGGSCLGSSRPSLVATAKPLVYVQKRYKKKGAGGGKKSSYKREAGKGEEEEQEEEEEEDEGDELGEGEGDESNVFHETVISLRLDAIGKTCFKIARAKFDESFYSGLIRINGERVGKKSHEVREGDEIDFIKGFNLDKRDQVDINRVNILKVDDKAASSGRVRISFRKTNNLTVANYERDPYEMA